MHCCPILFLAVHTTNDRNTTVCDELCARLQQWVVKLGWHNLIEAHCLRTAYQAKHICLAQRELIILAQAKPHLTEACCWQTLSFASLPAFIPSLSNSIPQPSNCGYPPERFLLISLPSNTHASITTAASNFDQAWLQLSDYLLAYRYAYAD